MMKLLVGLVAGIVGFLVAFSFTARDEIAAEVDARLESDFAAQCVARMQRELPGATRVPDICGCMEAEFANRGFALTDAFGDDLEAMQAITRSCAELYG